MFEWVEIEGFRGINKLRIDGLTRFNVFVGQNGAGKTTVLEAMALVCGGANVARLASLNGIRGALTPTAPGTWAASFHRRQGNGKHSPMLLGAGPLEEAAEVKYRWLPIVAGASVPTAGGGLVLSGEQITGVQVVCTIPARKQEWTHSSQASAAPAGPVPRTCVQFTEGGQVGIDDLAAWYSDYVAAGHRLRLREYLQTIDPRAQGLEVLAPGGRPGLWLEMDGEPAPLPLEFHGAGLRHAVAWALATMIGGGGAILIDELCRELHYSSLARCVRMLDQDCARTAAQVFATTHNEELLGCLLEAFAEQPEALSVFRIEAGADQHRAVRIDYEQLRTTAELRWEIR